MKSTIEIIQAEAVKFGFPHGTKYVLIPSRDKSGKFIYIFGLLKGT